MVWDEAQLQVERTNGQLVNLAVIIQAATATTGMAASKESAAHFRKLLKALDEEI